ncbi:MAG TPA: histidine--tRNA ligase [Anaerolineales bacterium]|nr:histidine--tRNA ligase [Anaerolineales bacterium]
MNKKINTVKGTREFYPYEMALRNWLYGIIREVSELFGYQEYDGPFLESIDLYAAKSGEELVKEQSFVFPDRGGNLITLRPELTLSLARMVAQKQHELVYPLRWWSFGPFWRYEKPQKGRTREFFQWNIDLIGVNAPEGDAELVAICVELFRKVGLTSADVKVLVNDRRLMDARFNELGITGEKKAKVLGIIDRRDRMAESEWDEFVLDEGFSKDQLAGLKKTLSDKELYKSSAEMVRFFAALDALGVRDFVEFDARIVRGLDYYTGIVFEARDFSEGVRAILGGGHYDNLVEDVGGDPLPGVGFAMGDVVLPIILAENGKLPDFNLQPAKVLVTVFSEDTLAESFSAAAELRKAGIAAMVYPEVAKLGKQFKYADRVGVNYAVVIGPDEIAQGSIQIKDLKSGEQKSISRSEITSYLSGELARLGSA